MKRLIFIIPWNWVCFKFLDGWWWWRDTCCLVYPTIFIKHECYAITDFSLKDINETHLLSSFWFSFFWRSSFTYSCVFVGFISSYNIPWRYFRHLNERVRVIIKVSTNDVFWTWIHLGGSQTGFGWYNLNKLQCMIRYDISYVMWQMKEQILQSYLYPPS